MKILNLLESPPLPDDWDKAIYAKQGNFAQKLAYAKEKTRRLGTGSSRVAFLIDYQGRKTVLKIAKNKKGLHQNEHEADALNDYYLRGLGVCIPMIDYDEESNQPSWLHVEFARKATQEDFKKACGGTMEELIAYACAVTGKNRMGKPDRERHMTWKPENIKEDEEYVQDFVNYVGSYDHPLCDYNTLNNWGVYDGRPVIIDIGVSHDILKTYYGVGG